jgi:hypothetical protein
MQIVYALKKFEVDSKTAEQERNEALKKFLHQAEILKNFNRADINHCYEVFELEGDHYVVTEFIEGKHLWLTDRTDARRPLVKQRLYSLRWQNLFRTANVCRDARP